MLMKLLKIMFGTFLVIFILGISVNTYEKIVPEIKKWEIDRCVTAARNGNAEAQYALGKRYADGNGVPRDCNEALLWYTSAATQGYAKAQCELGSIYFNRSFKHQDYSEAIKWWTKAAEQGHAKAQFYLGVRYVAGEGVPQDYNKAVEWIKKAAGQEYYDAQIKLGDMYLTGEGVSQDYHRGVLWYQTAAHNDYEDNVFCKGHAIKQLQLTCEELALKHCRGEGVPQDYKEAAKWFARAAEHGYDGAGDSLILLYLTGKTGALNEYAYDVVVDCFTKAAEKGNADAQYILGSAYAYGHELFVSQNYKAAAKWYTMAAEQGHGKSQLGLGYLYEKGKGVFEDRIEAYKWYLLAGVSDPEATMQNLTAAQRRNGLRAYNEVDNPNPLNADQISEAEKRAKAEIVQIENRAKEAEKAKALLEIDQNNREDVITCLAQLSLYFMIVLGMWKIFAKAGWSGWKSLIPFYNFYILCRISGKSGWWLLLLVLLSPVYFIVIGIGLGSKFGKKAGFILGLIFLPFIFFIILGFSDAKYIQQAVSPDLQKVSG